MRARKILAASAGVVAMVLLAGCAGLFPHSKVRHERSSSLVDFLYPGQAPPVQAATPVLHLPLTIGLVFLPQAPGQAAVLDQAEKMRILESIGERFRSRKFVREIVPIPDYYLQGQRGFDGLSSLARLYNLDLVALVSYDQLARTDGNELSLTYLTIVGAYLFPGTSQNVNTMVDLAVVHPATRSLVLRAAGMDSRDGVSTEAGSSIRMRERSVASFHASAGRMIESFDAELLRFEDQVRKGTARVKIASSGGGIGGGGSSDLTGLLLLCALVIGTTALRRNTPQPASNGSTMTMAADPSSRPQKKSKAGWPGMGV